jgi:heme-degrading monooxygenase HmoA
MYTRATWAEISKDQVDAQIAGYPQGMKSIREAPGCLGIGLLANRETGAGVSISYWESKEAMLATEAAGEQIRTQAAAQAGVKIGELDRFEVVLQERAAAPASGVFVRVTDFVAPPEKIDAVVDVLRPLISEGRSRSGFRALLVMANRATGRMLVSSIWTTAADRDASRELAERAREDMSAARGNANVTISEYEVVYADVKLPTPV